jgi:SAM-dependent methyltransferase
MLKRLRAHLRSRGASGLLAAAWRRLVPARARSFSVLRGQLEDGAGREVGGPSAFFAPRGPFPVYAQAGVLDNCNFANRTLWEGQLHEGDTVASRQGVRAGRQYVREATDLHGIADAQYDFVLSSNTLEHVADPLRALREWIRVLRGEGLLVLVLPHRDGTFDHRRPVTRLEHILEDHARGMGEDDLTHLDEILRLHDLSRDPDVADPLAFAERARRNAEFRSLHHHVFDTRLATAVVDAAGLEIIAVEPILPYNILVVGRKRLPSPDVNRRYIDNADGGAWRSPFVSDRQGAGSAD